MRRCYVLRLYHEAMLTPVLPSSLPTTKVPSALLRWSNLRGLLWPGIYHCNDLSMQSSSILLEPNNPRRPLHRECSILDLLRSDQHRYGFLHIVFADAYTLLAVVVEEEQVWCYGMFCARFFVSQTPTTQTSNSNKY